MTMIKGVVFIKRKAGLSREEFREQYEGVKEGTKAPSGFMFMLRMGLICSLPL